jgi:prophage regulatory protein
MENGTMRESNAQDASETKAFKLPEGRDRIVRFPELTAMIGRPRSSVYLMISRGEFPPGKKIGARAVGWMESTVYAWLASR